MGIDRIAFAHNARAAALEGKYSGRRLVVLGGGQCVWEDHFALFGHNVDDQWDYLAVNDVGMFWDRRLEHWFSHHWDQLAGWQTVRCFHFEPARHLHTVGDNHSNIAGWGFPGPGTSGMGGILAGLAMGYERIVLCGIPLDDGPHFFDPLHVKTNFSKQCIPRVWEQAAREVFDGKVKSMSGWSRELLGAP